MPEIRLTCNFYREDILVVRIPELARCNPNVATRLQELCKHDLSEDYRHLLSKVMSKQRTDDALIANLDLIDDDRPSPIPEGVWNQFKNAFVEECYGENTDKYTLHTRSSNELRIRLFKMAFYDHKRRKSAFMLLGKIEIWYLMHGRPADEPLHPDLASGLPWPPKDNNLQWSVCNLRPDSRHHKRGHTFDMGTSSILKSSNHSDLPQEISQCDSITGQYVIRRRRWSYPVFLRVQTLRQDCKRRSVPEFPTHVFPGIRTCSLSSVAPLQATGGKSGA